MGRHAPAIVDAQVHSIISNNAGRDSDDVVTTNSQDLTAFPFYEFLPVAKRWLQTFERDGILHLRVHSEATTVALFTGIITDLDNIPSLASAALPFYSWHCDRLAPDADDHE